MKRLDEFGCQVEKTIRTAGSREPNAARISVPVRVHCGFHKCLTMYARRTYKRACRLDFRRPRGFKHFFHRVDDFYDHCHNFRITSVSGNCLDLERFDDIKVVRFVRDPRDLIVSAYYYHKRGAEHWCHVVDPVEADWSEVRGVIPETLPKGESLTSYLNKATWEDGMRAELAFRRYHFDSMREWPKQHPNVLVYRYEDIIGREVDVFNEIFDFLGVPFHAQLWGRSYAKRHAAGRPQARLDHIRNPTSGQWRDALPDDVITRIAEDYGDVLERYDYPLR